MKFASFLLLNLTFVAMPTVAQAGGVHARLVTNEQQGIVYALPTNSPFKVSKKAPEIGRAHV